MSQDQKFQKRWEFRRRDDEFESSSDDSKSNSSSEPVLKKHKLVSNLILPENDETSDATRSQQKGQLDPAMDIHFELEKSNKMHNGSCKKNSATMNKIKRGSMKEGNKKKSKRSTQEPVTLDDFKIFTESILEELKVARENMFAQMREEMKKLLAVELASRPRRKEGSCVQMTGQEQHQNSIDLGVKTQKCNGGSLERSVKRKGVTDSNNCYKIIEQRVNHDQAIEAIASNEKDKGERLRLSVKKPINTSNHSDQIVSSAYLTLPTVLSEQQVEKHRIDFSSSNYIPPGVAGDDTGTNVERANLMIDASAHRGYFSGIQLDEQFGSFSQLGSKNMVCFDQHSTQTSSMGIGFPVPLHQGLDNSFNIPSPVVLENSSRDNNIMGLRMNGGAIRFSGGSHTSSERFVANNFCSHMNYRTDGGMMAFGAQNLKGDHLYPN